jgi:2-methylcitrate dehydratase PrpD
VAAGTLIKLTPPQMTQAIALAATSIGGLMVAANTSVAREYHAGLSAMLGVHAALAAKKGYVAEEHVLEMPRGFFSAYGGDHLEDVTKDLGASWDITTNMAIKLVPGGHPHHAAAEAAANAAIAGDVDPQDVTSIVLSSPVPYAARTEASDRSDRRRAQPRLLHRGSDRRPRLWLDPRLARKGRRPGDRAAHRQDHRGSESFAVPRPLPAPPRRDGHNHA